MALELQSVLFTFENSTKCNEISFISFHFNLFIHGYPVNPRLLFRGPCLKSKKKLSSFKNPILITIIHKINK